MTDNSLRTAIARVALEHRRVKAINFGNEYACLCGEVLASNSHHVLSKHQADAVLAVLADLPESVIERAAEGLHDAAFGQELPEAPIDLARAALRAAFGGEQNDG